MSKNEQQARNIGQRAVLDNTQAANLPRPFSDVAQGAMVPGWFGETLLMIRNIRTDKGTYIQGCWLDWKEISKWLLSLIEDLLPESDLVPVHTEKGNDETQLLAGLPARLEPGPIPVSPGAASPLRMSLVIAWICIAVGAGAVAVLLSGTLSLSERRWAFVSAVTHELRTPLTTFRMYAEMLAEGMVPEEEKRKRYLQRLCVEADRLAHLVENVLSYARLERGSIRTRLQETTVSALLERTKSRLVDRATEAGMELVAGSDTEAGGTRVRVDGSAAEQILFNLVDNACKYASKAPDKRIHLESDLKEGRVLLKVRDHGPGVSRADSRLLFRPFRKPAKEAADSAPGVGLGLALSLRLARQMDARLYLDPAVTEGACFVLSLPAVT
jgi:signal transduction histidine kinase